MSSIAQDGVACGKTAQAAGAGDVEMQQKGDGAPLPPAGAVAAKAALRRALKAQRASLDDAGKRERDARIGAQVLAWWRRTRPPLLAVYWPLSGEPDLHDTYRALALEGAALALPVVVERHAPLAFAAWTPGEPMLTDPMGIAVPAQLRTVPRPPALLVPCLGFNEHGYRLGYGGGFYDRTLAGGVKPATLGIAYACQEADFGADVHDLPLDLIVTEATTVE
ncbi:5-formyltetrahydrofolate cyclo-ligase [Massilia niabensis]|uniref:5-formyltetrahydrofolate cyclo-ligase n=1 Tax=Massilia niabensis TaxID=544910 RepID=A0ABW0L3L8_9BURK